MDKKVLVPALVAHDVESARSRNIARYIAVVLAITVALALMTVCGFAGEEEVLTGKITSGLDGIYKIIKTIVIPVAGLALAFSAWQFLVGGERGVETAKKTILYTGIGVGIVFVAPLLVKTVVGWFDQDISLVAN